MSQLLSLDYLRWEDCVIDQIAQQMHIPRYRARDFVNRKADIAMFCWLKEINPAQAYLQLLNENEVT